MEADVDAKSHAGKSALKQVDANLFSPLILPLKASHLNHLYTQQESSNLGDKNMNAPPGDGTKDISLGGDEPTEGCVGYGSFVNDSFGPLEPLTCIPFKTGAECLELWDQLSITNAVGGDDGLTPAQFSPSQFSPSQFSPSQFSPTQVSQDHVVAAHVGPPSPHPARPKSSPRGTKWTNEMDAFFMERKKKGETYTVISRRMKNKFRVSVNPNILSKRFKTIAKQEAKGATVTKAISSLTPTFISLVQEEIRKICASDGGDLNELDKEVERQIPEALHKVTVELWVLSQGRGV